MAWQVTIEGKSILLDDLSENDFVEATRDADITWLRLYMAPASDPVAFYKLLVACAVRLGVTCPDEPKNVKESVALVMEHIKQVDDDLPKAFAEGGIPLGHTADGTETTTSSTSTEPEDGLQSGLAEPQ